MPHLKVNLRANSIEKVIYTGGHAQTNNNSLANLQTKYSSSDISKSSAKRYGAYMNAFLEMVRYSRHRARGVMKQYNVYISFLTLTLPEQQLENDYSNKRNLLNYLIIILKRKYNVVNYCWRAETQANGNIHYHILCDRYLNKKTIREDWENILVNNGYVIDSEATNGYKSFSTWVVGASDTEAIRRYMTKYMTKPSKPKNTDREDYEEPTRRSIEGRKIGCSDSMRKLEQFYQMNVTALVDFIMIVKGLGIVKENKQDWFSAYYIDYQSVKEKSKEVNQFVKTRKMTSKSGSWYKKSIDLPDLLKHYAAELYEQITSYYGCLFVDNYA